MGRVSGFGCDFDSDVIQNVSWAERCPLRQAGTLAAMPAPGQMSSGDTKHRQTVRDTRARGGKSWTAKKMHKRPKAQPPLGGARSKGSACPLHTAQLKGGHTTQASPLPCPGHPPHVGGQPPPPQGRGKLVLVFSACCSLNCLSGFLLISVNWEEPWPVTPRIPMKASCLDLRMCSCLEKVFGGG